MRNRVTAIGIVSLVLGWLIAGAMVSAAAPAWLVIATPVVLAILVGIAVAGLVPSSHEYEVQPPDWLIEALHVVQGVADNEHITVELAHGVRRPPVLVSGHARRALAMVPLRVRRAAGLRRGILGRATGSEPGA
jgi:hypothetical protein